MLLEHEQIRNSAEGKWHRWDDHFPETTLDGLIGRFRQDPDDAARTEAANRLAYLYKQRAEAGRERRARAAEKCRFMTMLAPLLLILITALTISAELVSRGGGIWREVVLAASAGALGSVLAGTLKLRDRLVELDDLRAFGSTLRVQPLVGATMGIIVLVVLQGDLIRLDSCDPGASAAKSATGDLSTAVGVAVTRTELAQTFMDERMTATEAQCTSRRFLAAFSPAELSSLVNAQSEAELPKATQQRAQAAAQACLAHK